MLRSLNKGGGEGGYENTPAAGAGGGGLSAVQTADGTWIVRLASTTHLPN